MIYRFEIDSREVSEKGMESAIASQTARRVGDNENILNIRMAGAYVEVETEAFKDAMDARAAREHRKDEVLHD